MKLLAFDLSTRRGTIALANEKEILDTSDWSNDRRSSAPFFAALGGISSLCAISDESEFCVIGDAKRASFFFAKISGGLLANDLELLSENEMDERISSIRTIPIYASDQLPQFTSVKLRFPSAKLLCLLAQTVPQNLARAPLAPIYLREPHITTPRSAQK
jgi:tRNA A37 threonylcarbamoyladenosine modification protein TsaB